MTSHGMQRRKDGTTFPVEVRVGPIESRGQRLYLALARDVTERRAIEEALASARDQAVEASRLKSDFLANMSHEIRTPLNGILGMTGLLLDSELSASQRDDLNTVLKSAEHLLALINDILDLARIEAGRVHVDAAPIDLEEVRHGVAGLLSAAAEEKGIEFILRIAPDTPRTVIGDGHRLRQVLVNLAGNAVKFTERGHVLLDAEPVGDDEAGVQVRFAVTDTGVGIPADDLLRVFEKFTQVDPSAKRRHGGTGLGLTISRQLVEAMGGRIGARSTPGVGSEFYFMLPMPLGEAPERRVWPRELIGVRTLVVDDNAVNRRVLM
jgi:signal transduction histidine kinase